MDDAVHLLKQEVNEMTKGEIKKAFKDEGIQLGAGSMEGIEYELAQVVKRMAKRCKEGNLKRLTPELFYIAMGRYATDY